MTIPNLKLSIKQRLFISFAVLVVSGILYALLSLANFQQFHQHFVQSDQENAGTNLVLEINTELSELQRLITAFNHDDRQADIAELRKVQKKMVNDIDEHIENYPFKKQEDEVLLEQVKVLISRIGEQLEPLQQQRTLRNDYIHRELVGTFIDIHAEMALISSEVDKGEGEGEGRKLIKQLWEAQLAISEAELSSHQYFYNHQHKDEDYVKEELALAETQLMKVLELPKSVKVRQELKKMIDLIQVAENVFISAIKADSDYLDLTDVVLAGEFKELHILSEQLKTDAVQEQKDILRGADHSVSKSQTVLIVFSILGLFIIVVVNLVINRYILNPLTLITDTFMELVVGRAVSQIPGVDRSDEIGNLARAADVFNDVNEATKQLLAESEALTTVLASRERELLRKNEDLTDFTRIASHDLKSPIQGIADLALWIEEDLGDNIPEDVQSNLNKIGVRVERMQNLIDSLLQYSKAGDVTGKISDINVSEMIQETLDLIAIPPEMEVSIHNDLVKIEAIKAPLQTTLRNLLANAVKHHSKTNGHINICFFEKESNYILTVEDDGSGILEEDQKSIFELFRTVHKGEKSTGMGLAFCKRMVEANGGQIEVDSVAGEGATFRVWWPK